MTRIIIAGSRGFSDYEFLHCIMDISSFRFDGIDEVVSGGARGADLLGERWANEHDIPIRRFHAQWDKYGKRAGYLRNKEMAEYATHLVAFWDGKSKGTRHMISLANEAGLVVTVVRYNTKKET